MTKKNLVVLTLFAGLAAVAWAATSTFQILGNYSSSATVVAIQTPQLPQFQDPASVGSYAATWFNNDRSRKELIYITGLTPGPTPTPGLIATPPVFVCTRGYSGTTAFAHNGTSWLDVASGKNTTTITPTPSPTQTQTATPTNTPTITPTPNPTTVTLARVDGHGLTFPSNVYPATSFSGLQYVYFFDPPSPYGESGVGNANTDPFGIYSGGIVEIQYDSAGSAGVGAFRLHKYGSYGEWQGDDQTNVWLMDGAGNGSSGGLIVDTTARISVAPAGTPTPGYTGNIIFSAGVTGHFVSGICTGTN